MYYGSRPAVAVAVTAVVLALISAGAWSYPTSVNWVPTANTLGANQLLVEFDNCGYSKPVTTDSLASILTQIGIGPRLEFGWDQSEDSTDTYRAANGKLQLLAEAGVRPAIAVGAMDLWRGSKPTTYAVLSKTVGDSRLHCGVIRGSFTHGIMVGADRDIGEHMWIGLDYLPGDQSYVRLGVSHTIGSGSYLTLTAGRPNDGAQSDTEVGITISTYLGLGR